MAIIRSRTVSADSPSAAGSSIARAVQDMRAQLAKARDEGREAGLREAADRITTADGRAAKALAEVERKFNPVLTALSQASASIEQFENKLIQASEAEIVRLAVAIAERIIRRTVETDPEWMREVVREALRQIPDRRHVRVRMHGEDGALVREHQRRLTGTVPSVGNLEFIDDANLPRGSCVLESSGTTLDASLLSSFERVTEELKSISPSGPFVVPLGTAADVPVDPKNGPT